MRKILITGSEGFIGSHLVELLFNAGYQLRCLVQYNSFNQWGWLEELPFKQKLDVVLGDIRDPKLCENITKDMDAVIHLAALIGIPYSYVAPHSYVDTNVIGTLNLCEAALKNKIKKFIHTSTSEVYGTALYVPIDEKHPLQPQSPYSASKISADAMAMSYYNSFELPLVIARPFNTYGPRQSARAIIPTVISQISKGYSDIKLGNLTPTRNLNYVQDTCQAFKAILESDNVAGEIINLGSESEISVGDLALKIATLMSAHVNFIQEEQRTRKDTSEVYRLTCNAEKLKKLTGYEMKLSLEEGLSKTIQWFSECHHAKSYKPELYTV